MIPELGSNEMLDTCPKCDENHLTLVIQSEADFTTLSSRVTHPLRFLP